MTQLPTGTVTLLFTDVEGSTRLLQDLQEQAFGELLDVHKRYIRRAGHKHRGVEVGSEGDGLFFSFASAADALAAALEAQLALESHDWPAGTRIRVRMGVHTGEAQVVAGDYVGLAIHQAKRISSVAHGGQTLVSRLTRDLVASGLLEGTQLRRIGALRLKDFEEPQDVFQLMHPDLQDEFPPLRTVGAVPNNLPSRLSSFVGRAAERQLVADALERSRLVTLTGPGGSGKTRTAVEVASEVGERFDGGVWMADLAPLADPELVFSEAAHALGIRESGEHATTTQAVAETVAGRPTLLILDNCEHLADACAAAATNLLRATPDLAILATSREPLHLEGESIVPVPPMIAENDAHDLFVDRARQHDPSFDPHQARDAVAEVCRLTDGLPLAIELAAAYTRVLSVYEIAERLGSDRFRVLRSKERGAAGRHATLEATVDWGYELLMEPERRLLARLSVFSGHFTLDAAEAICSGDGIATADVGELLTGLVDRSFLLRTRRGRTSQYWLLETIRQYAWDKLPDIEASTPRDAIAFVREGEVWRIGRPGEEVKMNDRKGLAYLAVLLASPGVEHHVLELAGSSRDLDRPGADVLDPEAIGAYKERLAALEDEIAEARTFNDPVRAERAEGERAAIAETLARATGLGGRSRNSSAAAERARASVTKAIRSAIEVLAEHAPNLAVHLTESVRTGTFCAYEGGEIAWDVRV